METAAAYEVMNWRDMEAQFKDEFILIGDPEYDEHNELVRGRLLFHGTDREKMYDKLLEVRPKHSASRYTGVIPGNILINL